jgi:thioredoxin 1
MATIALTEENFDATVEQGIVLVDCWASWCGPCRMFAPIFEAASEAHPDIVFGKIDTEDQRALAERFRIQAIPTVLAYRDGILVFQQAGALMKPHLDEIISKIQALDMDEVRAQLAQ